MTWSKFSLKYHSQLWHLKQSTVSSLALTDHSALFATGRYHSLSSAPILLNLCESAVVGPRLAKVTQLQWLPAACSPPAPQLWWAWGLEPRTGYSYTVTHLPTCPGKQGMLGKALQSNTQQCCLMSFPDTITVWHVKQTSIFYCFKAWSGPCLTLGQSPTL